MDGLGGGVGDGKSLNKMKKESYDMYMHPQRANIPLQSIDRYALTLGTMIIRSPQPNWSLPLVPFHQQWIYITSKNYSEKADKSTLANGGSENAYIVISCSYKLG